MYDNECILGKIRELENKFNSLAQKFDSMDDELARQIIVDTALQKDLESIQKNIVDLKTDVVSLIQAQTQNMWQLISVGAKVLLFLLVVILLLIGIKVAPDLLPLF